MVPAAIPLASLRRAARAIAALSAVAAWAAPASGLAQEMNYSSFQPGGRSALMGGAGVGGVLDTSAIYYNPARLAYIDNSSLSVSGSIFRAGGVEIEDALGPGRDLDTSIFDNIPVLISGMHRFESLPELSFGFGVVTRQHFSADYRGVERSTLDAIDDDLSPGAEDFAGQFESDVAVDEFAGILGVAWKPLASFAVAIAPTLAYRSQESRQRFVANAAALVGADFVTARTEFTRDFSLYQFSAEVPLSATWTPLETLSFGATLRPPSARLFGSGSALADLLLVAPTRDADGDIADVALAGSDAQDGLDTNFRTPLSITAGVEWRPLERWAIATSVAWTDGVSRESVLDVRTGQPFLIGLPDAADSSSTLTLIDSRRDLVHAAIGVEREIGERWAAYFGFSTDFSPVDIGHARQLFEASDGDPLSVTSIDLYHFLIGGSYRSKKGITAVGLGVSYGDGSTLTSDVDFVSDPGGIDPSDVLVGIGSGSRERDISFLTVSLILSYTHFF